MRWEQDRNVSTFENLTIRNRYKKSDLESIFSICHVLKASDQFKHIWAANINVQKYWVLRVATASDLPCQCPAEESKMELVWCWHMRQCGPWPAVEQPVPAHLHCSTSHQSPWIWPKKPSATVDLSWWDWSRWNEPPGTQQIQLCSHFVIEQHRGN